MPKYRGVKGDRRAYTRADSEELAWHQLGRFFACDAELIEDIDLDDFEEVPALGSGLTEEVEDDL